jgi:hypothetical protein
LFLACCLPFDRVDLVVYIFPFILFDFRKTSQGKNFKRYRLCFFDTQQNQNYVGAYLAAHVYNPTICPSPIVKRSMPGTTNKKTKSSISATNFWITVYRTWIFYASVLPIQIHPLCPRLCGPFSGIHHLCQYG